MMQCPSCSAPLVSGESRCVSCHALVNPQTQGTSALAPRLVTPPGAGGIGSPFGTLEPRTSDPQGSETLVAESRISEARIVEPRVSEDDAWRREVLERVRKRRQARAHALPLFSEGKPNLVGGEPLPETPRVPPPPLAVREDEEVEEMVEGLESPFENEALLRPEPAPDVLASLDAPLSNFAPTDAAGDLSLRPAEPAGSGAPFRGLGTDVPSQSLVERARSSSIAGLPSPRSLVGDLPLVEPSRIPPRLVEPPRSSSPALSSRAASLIDRIQAAFIDLGTWSALTATAFYFASRIARTSILGLGPAWQGLALFAAVLGAAYILFFGGLSGATPGKIACGIQVRRYDGSPLGPLGSLVRGVLGIAGVAFLGIGIWPALWDKDRRALHDRLTDSRVTLARF